MMRTLVTLATLATLGSLGFVPTAASDPLIGPCEPNHVVNDLNDVEVEVGGRCYRYGCSDGGVGFTQDGDDLSCFEFGTCSDGSPGLTMNGQDEVCAGDAPSVTVTVGPCTDGRPVVVQGRDVEVCTGELQPVPPITLCGTGIQVGNICVGFLGQRVCAYEVGTTPYVVACVYPQVCVHELNDPYDQFVPVDRCT